MPSWPTGVQTTTITFGKGITVDGNVTSATLTVTPIFSGTKAVKWATDSTPLLPFVVTATAVAGAYGSVQIPVVDQAGWKDDGQHDYSLWAYKLEELPKYGTTVGAVRTKYVQPITGQTTIDFDDIPDGSVGLPASAPVVPVSSVAGLTGDVTVDELAQAGVGGVTDAGVNAILTDPASTSATSLAATYLPARGLGPRIVWLGDSITEGSNDNDHQSIGQSYPLMTQLALQGKGLTVRNAGIQGNTSAQMLARFDTDVTPYSPTVVPILAGTNDIGAGVSLAAFQANIIAIVAKIRAIGATPVLASIPPNDVTARIAPTALFNLWLTRYAATLGAPFIDHHKILTDPATGTYKAGYSTDGTHPAAAAQNLMGQAAAAVLGAYLRPWSPPLVHENTDTVQILGTNPLLINDANSDGCPDGWDHYGDSSVTVSLVTDTQVPGKMVKLTATGATGIHVLENYISTGYAPGDTIAIAGVLSTDGGIQTQIKLDFQSSGQNAFPVNATPTVTRGVFYQEAVIPTGTGAIGFQIISGAGTGYIQVGQFTVYNLTALGLA